MKNEKEGAFVESSLLLARSRSPGSFMHISEGKDG